MAKLPPRNYILLPRAGIQFADATPATRDAIRSLTVDTRLSDVLAGDLTNLAVVLDSTSGQGAKLVQLSESELPLLRAQLPGVLIVPEVFYYPQLFRERIRTLARPLQGQAKVTLRIQLVEANTTKPVVGATVVAFTNFADRTGEQATSDAQGVVSFKTIANQKIDQLYVYPKVGYWSYWKQKVTLKSGDKLPIQPVKLDYQDAKSFFYPAPTDGEPDGTGLTVGVIDTGAGPHPDLNIAGGACTVTGDDPADFTDVDEHGSHVSGIIAAQGTPPTGVRGIAPGATLRAYRVFGRDSDGASNFAIIKAIEQAVADKCDLLNMSLGGGPVDTATQEAITFAYQNGTICFVATGNDGRQPVSFPASFSLSLAVSAMGRKGTFPANTTDAPNVAAPFGTDKKNFIAAFSNVGPSVDFTGPGVGIVSTVPGGYSPLSGTSMACPAATGIAARLLSGHPDLVSMPRTAARSDAMIQQLAKYVRPMGFGPTFEGTGMLLLPGSSPAKPPVA
jgi:subtilisin